jgi:predicted nucleic acid-binding Zn ribbon protein
LTADPIFRIFQEMQTRRTKTMKDMLWMGLFFAAYLLLVWVILPRLGVPT